MIIYVSFEICTPRENIWPLKIIKGKHGNQYVCALSNNAGNSYLSQSAVSALCSRLQCSTQQLQPPAKLISSQQIGFTCRDALPQMVCHIKWKSWHEIVWKGMKKKNKKRGKTVWETLLDGSSLKGTGLVFVPSLTISWMKTENGLIYVQPWAHFIESISGSR